MNVSISPAVGVIVADLGRQRYGFKSSGTSKDDFLSSRKAIKSAFKRSSNCFVKQYTTTSVSRYPFTNLRETDLPGAAIPVLLAVSRIVIALHPSPTPAAEEGEPTVQSPLVRLASEEDVRRVLKDAARAAGNDISLVSCVCVGGLMGS